MSAINLLLFGDQTVEKLSPIKALVKYSRTSPLIRRFLREATDAVQTEASKLIPEERAWFDNFITLLELAEKHAQREPNELIGTVLMYLGRVGELLKFAEEDPSILGSLEQPSEVLALCTGAIPAAVAVAANDTSEVLSIAIALIPVVFRFARDTNHRSKLIDKSMGSWGTTVVGLTPEKAQPILDAFHKSQNIPPARKIFVSVVAKGWLTLMGPPTTAESLWAWSPDLSQAPRINIDLGGLVHGEHLPELDLERVIGNSPLLDTPITPKARMLSPFTCEPYEVSDLRSLLEEIIPDIAQNILYLSRTLEAAISNMDSSKKINLVVVGFTGHQAFAQRALEAKGFQYGVASHSESQTTESARGGSDLIAIVGMSGRFPGSGSIEGFWQDLLDGKNHVKKIPKSRFDIDQYYDATLSKKNSISTQLGCFLDKPGMFDNRLFNVSPREALQMDPLQRLLLTTSYEALEMAGYSKDATLSTESNRIATYFGQGSDDQREIVENEGIDIYYVPSISRAFAPGRLNYHFKFGGAAYSLDCACASSTTAIQMACSSLIGRECDTALAGGANVIDSPNPYAGLSKGGFLSSTGNCQTYHDDADGYCRGEGIGVVVLKRLEDAIADNDNILAVIRGSARTYSSTSSSITHPSTESQQRLYEQLLQSTGVAANEISYVEMHGTGTQAGDFIEMSSVTNVFGHGRTKENPLVVGAVKASMGHGEAAAGITSLVKVLMMMKEQKIPPQPEMPFKVNHRFPPLEKMNVHIANGDLTLKPSTAGDGKTRVFLNSFDAAGGNTALLLENAPKRPEKTQDPRSHHVVTFSARTANSLKGNKENLLQYLQKNPETNIADIAYTTTARRLHDVLRSAFTVKSTEELVQLVGADLSKEAATKNKTKTKSSSINVAFAFTGQGSQYSGMGRNLYQHSRAFRTILSTYEGFAIAQGLPSFVHLISDGDLDMAEETTLPVQLAVVTLEVALAQMWSSWGIKPSFVIGHSLGEYAALCVAGVLSVSDALYLVGKRATLIEDNLEVGAYAMLAISKSADSMHTDLESRSLPSCQVACINAPNMTVISGKADEIAELKTQLQNDGVRSTLLKVPYGFHSKQLDPILEEYEAVAKGVTFQEPLIPVASTLLGELIKDGSSFSASYLARQARESVNFVGALEAAQQAGLAHEQTIWMEMGPEPVCLGLIRSSLGVPLTHALPTVKSSEDNWATISSTLTAVYTAGLTINWPEFHKDHLGSLSLLNLPTYAFDEKEYWTSHNRDTTGSSTKAAVAAPAEKALTPSISGFPTTTLQRLEKEMIDGGKITVTFASNTNEQHLLDSILGHVVDGLTICPTSVFGDMALSLAKYVYMKLNPNKKVPDLSLMNMEITHAVVVTGKNPDQIIRATAEASTQSDMVNIKFTSHDGKPHENGGCQVRFGDNSQWKSDLSRTLFLLSSRMDSLKASPEAHALRKPVVYKLFSNLVDYGDAYQGIQEVVMDSDFRDAVSRVKFQPKTAAGNFMCNPYWLDNIVQVAGFMLNCALKYPEDVAFLSLGFDVWRLFEDLSETKTYHTYVCIEEPDQKGVLTGDAYVFSDNKLVSAVTGIKFQKMKKTVLGSLLRQGMPSSSRAPTAPKAITTEAVAERIQKTGHTRVQSESQRSDLSETSGFIDSQFSTPPHEESMTPASSAASCAGGDGPDISDIFFKAVASESGADPSELEPDTLFADLGIDSLMAITVMATVRNSTGVELAGTFFMDHPTVAEARSALGPAESSTPSKPSVLPEVSVEPPPTPAVHVVAAPKMEVAPPKAEVAPPKVEIATPKEVPSKVEALKPAQAAPTPAPTPSATSSTFSSKVVSLQGRASSNETPLFLFADGTGSVMSYIQLPPFPSGRRVYGVESPFISSPSEHTSIEETSEVLVAAIRKTQPSGPYLLGGFSAGAALAYQVAHNLLTSGEKVDGLFLIGLPAPTPKSERVEASLEQLEKAGLTMGKARASASAKQKDHFVSTVQAFMSYKPVALDAKNRPAVTVAVLGQKASPAVSGEFDGLAGWVRESWLNTDAKGWQQLVGDVQIHEVDAEHSALMSFPNVSSIIH